MTDVNKDRPESISSDKHNGGIKVEDLLTNPNFSKIFEQEKQPVIVCGDPSNGGNSKAAQYLKFSAIPQFVEQLAKPSWDQKPTQEILDTFKSPASENRAKPDLKMQKIIDEMKDAPQRKLEDILEAFKNTPPLPSELLDQIKNKEYESLGQRLIEALTNAQRERPSMQALQDLMDTAMQPRNPRTDTQPPGDHSVTPPHPRPNPAPGEHSGTQPRPRPNPTPEAPRTPETSPEAPSHTLPETGSQRSRDGGQSRSPEAAPPAAPGGYDNIHEPGAGGQIIGSPGRPGEPGPSNPTARSFPGDGQVGTGAGLGHGSGGDTSSPAPSAILSTEDILDRWASKSHDNPVKALQEMLRNLQETRFRTPYSGHLPPPAISRPSRGSGADVESTTPPPRSNRHR